MIKTVLLRLLFVLILFMGIACSDDLTIPPPDPVSLQVYSGVTTNQLYITWGTNSSATNYRLSYRPPGSNDMILLTNTVESFYTHTGIAPGTTNEYQIVVVGQGGVSSGNLLFSGYTAPLKLPASSQTTNYYTNNGLIYTYNPNSQVRATNELVILTLNMHTYQESGQDAKFDAIVRFIADLDVDFVAFQENAQHRNSPFVDGIIRSDNMTRIIAERLKQYYNRDYYYTWDWAHYGWDVYEEGMAVMSKEPLLDTASTWVSTVQSTGSLVSRKAVYGRTQLPHLGITVNFVSTHLHWRTATNDIEQNTQVSNVRSFAASRPSADLTIVCGDYNSQPTESDPVWGEGYTTMVAGGEYIDTFLVFNPAANNLPENSIYDTVKGGFPGRIDYVFMRTNAAFEVVSSQIIFTPAILGTVSDHYGVLTRIRKVQ